MNQTIPFKKDLVLVGGGHSHVQVIRMLAMKKALGSIRVTLISDESTVCYSGMLPGCLAGLYRPDEMEMELRPICIWAGVRFVRARVAGLDPVLQQVHFDDGRPTLAYDVLSINVGSIPRGMDTPGGAGTCHTHEAARSAPEAGSPVRGKPPERRPAVTDRHRGRRRGGGGAGLRHAREMG